ncbi:MAG: HD domain-containing protein [Lachnospiraceae bacterium]|nr:HD domain-containing protein [Lachnospiraceae bacterium]
MKYYRANFDLIFSEMLSSLNRTSRFPQTKGYIQHGRVSVYEHSIHVARVSCKLALFLHLRVDYASLIRGGLLHDYFLYDWHDSDKSHRLHGFRHPKTALRNAKEDFDLTKTEQNIIVSHMFPLTLRSFPCCLEAWIVCIADKICATKETFHLG